MPLFERVCGITGPVIVCNLFPIYRLKPFATFLIIRGNVQSKAFLLDNLCHPIFQSVVDAIRIYRICNGNGIFLREVKTNL